MSSFDQVYSNYINKGWHVFDDDDALRNWVNVSLEIARSTVSNPDNRKWLRHGDTWFAGVNLLDNGERGAVMNGPELSGQAIDFIEKVTNKLLAVDKGQLSVCYPGYPKPSTAESEAAYSYRLKRDAAHLDGVLKENGERFLKEYHDYVLAIPMVEFDRGASPFVVWSQSHSKVRDRLLKELKGYPCEQWFKVPLKQTYQALRREIFETCERVEVHLKVGQALVAHRLLLHGTAPWQVDANASKDGRMICFFRPATLTIDEWLNPLID